MELALFQLLALRLRGGLRMRLRQLLSVRGLVYFGVSCLVPAILWVSFFRAHAVSPSISEGVTFQAEALMVLALAAATLLPLVSASSPPFHFTAEEIRFLRAAPFSRQSLVLYKVLSSVSGSALTALALAAVACLVKGGFPMAVFVGTLLTLLFVRLSSATLRSMWQLQIQMRFASALRWSSPAIAAVVLMMAGWILLGVFAGGSLDGLVAFCDTPAGEFLLLPFKAFVRITLADRMFPDLIFWSAFATAINLFLLLLLLRVDRGIEVRIQENPNLDTSLGTVTLGTVASNPIAVSKKMLSPFLASRILKFRFGGIAPLVWQQVIHARRTAGPALLGISLLAIMGGPILVSFLAEVSTLARIGICITFAIFVLPKVMIFDFRRDLKTLSRLKGMPVHPISIALGQLAAPTILSSCIELLFLCSTMVLLGGAASIRVASLIPFVLPFNLLLYGIENIVFLLLPFRMMPTGRVDFEFFGRSVVEILAKMFILGFVIVLSLRLGRFVSNELGGSSLVFYLSSWLGMTINALLVVWLVAFVFKRIEVQEGS